VRRALKIGSGVLAAVISIAVILIGWVAFLKLFDVQPFIGKGPGDVWKWLFTADDAGAHRALMRHESYTTLRDAFLGLLFGTIAAVLTAISFNLYKPLQRTFMPVAMVLRSVPLVAMTPLIVLIFGRGLTTVTVIAGIVTFFPTLVNVTLALRDTPKESMDLLRAYGASPLRTLMKVQIPSSLPALFASLRVAAPLALVGALLSEWLATGKGLGYAIIQAGALSDYNGLWSRVALVTIYSVVLYKAIGGLEGIVLKRFAAVAPR
jgi:ABC-type nitrate/sulfonate/bicarbonate transport system permease component